MSPRHPGRPTIYLDQSTLSAAFRSSLVGQPGYARYRPLFEWITRIAHEANLCLSIAHPMELAKWDDRAQSDAMAAWLDGLPVVWVRSSNELGRLETNAVLDAALMGVQTVRDVDPFTLSLIDAFDTPEARTIDALLVDPTISHLVRTARQLHAQRGDRDHVQFLRIAADLRYHDGLATSWGWDQTVRATYTDGEQTRLFIEDAREAHRRGRYAAPLDNEVTTRFVDLANSPATRPLHTIRRRFNDGFAGTSRRRRGGHREARALRGTLGDMMHAWVGAAYCDVFTCDHEVDRWLGDVRAALGLSRQLSEGSEGTNAFVDALQATVDICRRREPRARLAHDE